MTSFIVKTLRKLKEEGADLSEMVFVLPSKRAGAFLRKEIARLTETPVFSPEILSIQDFLEDVSELKTLDSITTVFEFYSVYQSHTPSENTEKFENFSTWSQTLIQDFNEIDRYLVPPEKIFNYLSDIKDIHHWSLQPEKTDLVKNYLAFWRRLPHYYQELRKNLLKQKRGYQGLVYRRASELIAGYAKDCGKQHVFLGFNSLSAAEQLIIQEMLKYKARIFWDIDELHFRDRDHDVSLFLRTYANSWPYYIEKDFQFLSSEFTEEKQIEIAGIPKNVGQAKYVGQILAGLDQEQLGKTAVVLGDESLLLPVINSLPENVKQVNVTMGYPLKYSPYSTLFDSLFDLLKTESEEFYYKDIIAVLSNPEINKASDKSCERVIRQIKEENILYLSKEQLRERFPAEQKALTNLLFPEIRSTVKDILRNFEALIDLLKSFVINTEPLKAEFLYQHYKVLEQLSGLLTNFSHINTAASLYHFYKEINNQHTLDFHGKPFSGLQIMGVLESRVLDFETVILTSVNEGVLPAGKSGNSFIPYDLKRTFQLPTYKEKDAVYTYHFYHLLQRAKKIYLLHNTDTESNMGGEKSRFLLQLQIEKQPRHKLEETVVLPQVPRLSAKLQTIHKTPQMLERIKEIAEAGFSPSALTTYIRNPLDFYTQYILKIRDREEVEETVALNTLGTVIHDTLEEFYRPLKGKTLRVQDLEDFKKRTASEVKKQFEDTYSKIPLDKGKNLLIFKVAQRYIRNFLKMEIRQIQEGMEIEIREVETKLTADLNLENLDFPVKIGGTVDRVDMSDGVLRIIDYKTGKVSQNQLEIVDWEEITTDYDKYAKPFQVLTYASILLQNSAGMGPVEAGVISFKNLKEGFLKFVKKDAPRSKTKNTFVDQEVLAAFNQQLKNLISEICDPEIPFVEKEIKQNYGAY